MGQKSSSKINGQKQLSDQKTQLKNTIKNKLKAYNQQIKQKIENNYSVSNFNSNAYIAYNIKKKSDSKNQFSWFDYAKDECELILSQKAFQWIEQTQRLLKYMKNDPKVHEFQKNQIISLIYTIETMTEHDYLIDVPMEQYEDFFADDKLDEIAEAQIDEQNKVNKQQNPLFYSNISMNQESPYKYGNQRSQSQTLTANPADFIPNVNIIEYNDQRLSYEKQHNKQNLNEHSINPRKDNQVSIFNTENHMNEDYTILQLESNKQTSQKDDKNICTLIEKIPIFEEELQENINGTKIDTNLMRSEVYTMMADQHANVLQYNANLEQRQLLRERNQNAISQMYNNTLLLNNAAQVAYQENLNQMGNDNNNENIAQVRNSNEVQISVAQQSEIYLDALKMVNFYKRISLFLEKSLNEKLNGLRALKKLYKKYFMEKYSTLLNELQRQGNMEVKESLIDDILKDVLQFIHFYLYCLIFFYDLDNILPQKKYSQLVNKENLWNFLVNIFFSDDEIYTVCFELIQASLIEKEKSLQSKMINLEKVLPHHLEIDPKFCLNNKTIEWAKQHLIKIQSKQQNQLACINNGQQNNLIPKINNQTNKQQESPNLRLSAKNLQSNCINNIRLSQQHTTQIPQKKQLEMLEEESEIFLMNQNSKSSSTISQVKVENKENQLSLSKTKSNCSDNTAQRISQDSVQQASCSPALNKLEYQEQVLGREKRILSQSKCPYNNSKDSDPYRASMQDQDGKDEILEETCIPKLSQLEEKDSSFIQQQMKPPTINISSPKSHSNSYSPNIQNKNLISQKNSSKSNSSKNSKQNSSIQETRLTQYNSNNAFRHQQNYLQAQRKNSLEQSCPYYKAIKKLQNLTFYNSPIHKMKLLVQCFELIPQCVQEFYEQNIDYLEQNLIASDDLINILVFIVIKSKCTQLNSHLKLISSFLSKSTQQSKIGYYCTTLQIVCGYLESDKIYENVESLRTKSEFFNKTIIQMNNSYLRKSNFNHSIDPTSSSKIVSVDKIEFQNVIENQQGENHQTSDEITTNVFQNVVIA